MCIRDRFEVWQGLDRTQGQSGNSWAVFSDRYENIQSLSYITDHSSMRNYAYIAGAGEGEARTVVTLDQTNGQPRRCLLYTSCKGGFLDGT